MPRKPIAENALIRTARAVDDGPIDARTRKADEEEQTDLEGSVCDHHQQKLRHRVGETPKRLGAAAPKRRGLQG
jgi:hypothetical protein